MGILWQDIRYGIRMLVKRPGITLIAVLTLALGVGANTAIYSVVDAVLLRPLPYKQPERLVFLSEWSRQVPGMSISMANFNDWRGMNTVFETMFPYRANRVVLTGQGDAEALQMREVTAELFPTFGVQPVLGRALNPGDDKVGSERVVLLSDGFWARKFARDPNVIGRKLELDKELYTIIGVLPSSQFHGSWRQYSVFSSLWRHEDTDGGPANRGSHPGIYAVARMKPGVTLEQAQAEMRGIAERLAKQYPNTNAGASATVDSLLNAIVGDVRPSLLVLMAAVGFVLLIACANVANLMLARATERQKEMAVRTALGAGRFRLVRQLMTESLLLAILGSTLGLLVAFLATRALVASAPANVPRIDGVSINTPVLLFTLGLTMFTGIFFGLFPAWQATRGDVHDAIKEGGRGGTATSGRKRFRSALVVTEVAVSLVLLVGAGLMIKSLYRVLNADPGFKPSGVLTAGFSLPEAQYTNADQRISFVNQLVAKLQAAPGVEVAAFKMPLLGGYQSGYVIEGRPLPEPGKGATTDITRITADGLKAMGIPILRGRNFTASDNEKSEHVCIIDTTMAESTWPGENPIGKHISIFGRRDDPKAMDWMTVVGVAAHTKNYGVDQPSRVETYVPYAQRPMSGGVVVLRTTVDPMSLAPALQTAIHSLDKDVPVAQVRALGGIIEEGVAPRRLSAMLLSVFAGLALLLAAVGIYGVMSYMVTQRNQEIGIRVAFGAQRADILKMILRSGMALLLLGLVIGLGGALYLSRFLESLLFQVPTRDPMIFASIPLILAAVALVACYLPARRAMGVDPIVALREE
jgi:putative ABC transport system permease protein